MNLVEPHVAAQIVGVKVPYDVYWVLDSPTPLAGMRYPGPSFPWSSLKAAGFGNVVSLHNGSYDSSPLTRIFSEQLEDLIGGGAPSNEVHERQKIKKAVAATLGAFRAGEGVVVHCCGGRGRSGTVLGCVLVELGFEPDMAIGFLDRLHKARGKAGWPESRWQSSFVLGWGSSL